MRRVEFFRHDLGEAELESVRRTLATPFVAMGPRVAEFEREFARLLGVEHVVGVSSCSMGLVVALRALGVGPGDEVIVPAMTYVATSNAALHLGARVVFADVDAATGLVDPASVEAALAPRTRAIVAVHLYGQMAPMAALRAIADRAGLALVEDSAHAITAARDGAGPGQVGDAAVFSFYATKEATAGDGGAIATRDGALAGRLRRLRNHGISADAADRHGAAYRHWDMLSLGFKAAMTDLDAAFLLPQLPRLDARRAARQALAERYEAALAGVPGVTPVRRDGRSAHHLFAVLVPPDRRDAVLAGLGERGIGCAVNYRAVHTLSYYRDELGWARDDVPRAAAFGDRTVSLPLWAGMAKDDVDAVVAALRESS